MPLYEYQCDACAKRFERIQKYSDPLVDTCPACSGVARRLPSSPAIQFKGTGFYITDYAKKPAGSTESDGKSAPASDAKGSSGGGDQSSGSATSGNSGTKNSGDSGGSGGSGGAGSSTGSSSSS